MIEFSVLLMGGEVTEFESCKVGLLDGIGNFSFFIKYQSLRMKIMLCFFCSMEITRDCLLLATVALFRKELVLCVWHE